MKSFSDYCEFRNAQESLFYDMHPRDKLSQQHAGPGPFDHGLSSGDESSISSDDEAPNKLLSMAEKLKWISIHGSESIRKKISDVLSSKFPDFLAGFDYEQAREELIRRNEEKRKKATDLARRSNKPYHR